MLSLPRMGATEDAIWNRAAFLSGKPGPRAGDSALSALLLAHGAIMNGGVLNCCQDSLSADELQAAALGYRYFGLSGVADLLTLAKLVTAAEAEEAEARLDVEYAGMIPDDDSLVQRFEAKFKEDPTQFGRLD
jgi:hypothetical protein